MKVVIKHCRKCLKLLQKSGEIPLDLYVQICDHQVEQKMVFSESGRNGYGHSIIRFLEAKGYISTTEVDFDYLAIKACGHKICSGTARETHEFCAFRDKHLAHKKPEE